MWVGWTKWNQFEGKKQPFYELMNECYLHCVVDFIVCLGVFNGHVGRCNDVFDGVYEECGVGGGYLDRRVLLMFCLE